MRPIYLIYSTCLLYFLISIAITTESSNAQTSQNSIENALSIHIMPQKVVYLRNETKPITLTITNTSLDSVAINVATELAHHLKVDVFDELDFPVSIHPRLPVLRSSAPLQEDITLAPDMTKTFEFFLDDFVTIERPGVYSIIALFYPQLVSRQSGYSVSNTTLISVLNEDLYYNNVQTDQQAELEYLDDYSLDLSSPDKTVLIALESLRELRRRGDGNRDTKVFLSTFDLRSLYLNISQSTESFSAMNQSEQRKELLDFSQRLLDEETLIFLQDHENSSIEETRYSVSKAMITTLVKTQREFALDIRRYIFHLEKIRQKWKIVNYNVQFAGRVQNPNSIPKSRLHSNLDYLVPADFMGTE